MVGYNSKKFLLIALCASLAGTAMPVQAVSIRIPVRSSKSPARTNKARTAFKSAFITSLERIKKFVTFDYLRHCDCPAHTKNQTLKNQIRRHPERLAAYTAAGIGILFGAYKLFFGGLPHGPVGPELPIVPPVPPVPGPEPIILPPAPIPPVVPLVPVIPVIDASSSDESEASSDLEELSSDESDDDAPPAPLAIPVQVQPLHDVEYVIIEPSIEHQAIPVQYPMPPIRVHQAVKAFPEAPLKARLMVMPEPLAQIPTPIVVAPKPDSPVPLEQDLQRSRSNSKGKEEEDESESISSDSGTEVQSSQSSQNNSFIMVSSIHGKLKALLSQPLQNLIKLSIPHEQGNPYDSEDLLLLGAACNHALITNDEKAIAHFTKNHVQSVRALTWYYYALAAGKEQLFQEGTFLIAHPRAHAILDFLNHNTIATALPKLAKIDEAYERISSHFGKFMKLNDAHEQHYGIDISHLPTQKQSLLFGHVDKNQNIIFIKPESHGTMAIKDLLLHGASYLQSLLVKGIAFFRGGASDDDADEYRKERVPTLILANFKVFNAMLCTKELMKPEQAQLKGKEAQARGISYMDAEVTRCMAHVENAEIRALGELLLGMMKQYDHRDLRFGREVILTARELNFITQEDYERLMEYIRSLPVVE